MKEKQAVSVTGMRKMVDETTWSHQQTASRKRGLHEQSYLCNEQEHSFPVARNAHESNGERSSGSVMRGDERGIIRPAGTISREGMRSCRNVVLPTPSRATMSALVYSALTMLLPVHLSWVDTPHKISDAILTSLDQFARRSVQLVPRPVETLDQTAR